MTTAVVLLGHGSRLPEANQGLAEVAGHLRFLHVGEWVEVAFLQLAQPGLGEVVFQCVQAGADRVVVQPFFLFPGAHVLQDIPAAVEALRRAHPAVEILLAPHLGAHRKLAEIAAERLQEVLYDGTLGI
jgi:sirohydrochlorin ferrochelatase